MGTKKFYIVALISFFDNAIKQLEIRAFSPYEAVKNAMIEFTDERFRESEIDFQNSEEYPTDLEGLNHLLGNSDMDFSVIEVGSFINK